MTDWRSRTELLIGDKNLARLAKSSVLVVGLGGVGAMAAEMISRSGVGSMTIIDGDTIQPSNINRQIPAINSTIGKTKTEVMESRLLDINPDLNLTVVSEFIRDERMKEILSTGFDYVVDAIDTLSPKIFLIYHSVMNNLRVVSSMGAGGKMDPTLIQVTDISGTYNCKLARIIRKRLHKLGIREGLRAVFSPEPVADGSIVETSGEQNKASNVGTISYMPAAFGCTCASVVIRDLIK